MYCAFCSIFFTSGKSPLEGGFSVSYENLCSSVVILRDELPHRAETHVLVLLAAHHQRGSLTDAKACGLLAVLLRQQVLVLLLVYVSGRVLRLLYARSRSASGRSRFSDRRDSSSEELSPSRLLNIGSLNQR